MAIQRIVVVPKPMDALPPLPDTAPDDPELRAMAERLGLARSEHTASLDLVRRVLAGHSGVTWLATPSAAALRDADLVVTIGGDGTFLTVARHAATTPMLGVNSSPSTSTGHYCGALPHTFAELLGAWLAGRLTPTALTRIRAEIVSDEGSRTLSHDALNDVLFANRTPVSSTRYVLRVDGVSELQLSSGIWIATASGSTAAIHSAGGMICPPADPRLQWRVREPYLRDGQRCALMHGFTEHALEIVSRSDKNAIYLDGHPEPFAVPRTARARLSRSPEPLLAYLAVR